MVNSFKERLNAPRSTSRFTPTLSTRPSMARAWSPHGLTAPLSVADQSTTPPGSPPPNPLAPLGSGSKPAAAPANSAIPSILDTLASIARQNASSAQSNPSLAAPAPTPAPAPVFTTSGGPPSNGTMHHAPVHVQAQPSMPFLPTPQPAAQPVNVPALPFAFPPPVLPAQGMAPAAPAATTVQLVAALAAQGMSIEKIASVIQMMGQSGAIAPAPQQHQMPQPIQTGYAAPPPVGSAAGPAPWDARPNDAHDRSGHHDGMRSPNRARGRSRSRSPARWDARGSPRTSRANDRGFEYGRPVSPGRGRSDDRDRSDRGNMPDYRQRSPQGRRNETPPGDQFSQDKWVEYDNSIPSGSIKVYSRTLFVGGVT